ncbi:NAD(P)-binding domain-containing protein [Oharaeibacter diazotrophicus]|uniref:Cation diffusion facilitator CzcD-associated flavoprotein CzcO n=2 Tax=Oharaeibacter diazotrophicus TaxID=1920512 RepID=A0A4R6RKJ9_9HYPH|nr:NAD(P)/FAD-dependent oxidoreductase [Oharaeibacter diazotrophicus]TDP87139.1 cation diffusion facilitator CzcD-associated flavoprotein CzcO [Oharaeibacter diazotrophicus]BBE70918.1 dihydropyrimidine dehydrogenase subunit A [Pleomorphomonas sp. SM30]GLS77667.1 FAD-dependent urate hydroxylase [Oharaeibacter diazotrophicus]
MTAPTSPLTFPAALPGAAAALAALAAEARADLAAISYPDRPWLAPRAGPDGSPVDDVIVVGAGQSGLVIAAHLRREGLARVAVLDRGGPGEEGPWCTYARMAELRTPKVTVGTEFGIPALSVRRWFETRYGVAAWARLERIPRTDWKDYLDWYAETLELPVEHRTLVMDVADAGDLVRVETLVAGRPVTRHARAVVIATGFDGAGAWRVPDFVAAALPPECYDHSNGPIDFARLKGRRVGLLGHGASAFDNAIAALRAGAASAEVCFRRARLPRTNPHRHIETAGMMTHYPALADLTRWRIARFFRAADQPPPVTAFRTALATPGFRLRPATPWTSVALDGDAIRVETPAGPLVYDHLILATGAVTDLAARPELRTLASRVALWSDRFAPPAEEADARLSALPYLDEGYGFVPRRLEDGWVGRVFAFNGLSTVSHGPHSTSISGHRHALPRVVRGVTRRLLLDHEEAVLADLHAYRADDLPIPDDFEDGFANP